MHRQPSIYAPSGIIGVHISMQMSRYARSTIDIRLQWHLRGAYLYANVEICAVNHRYTPSVASSGCISLCKCRDMHRQPSIYAFSGIIGVHISMQMSRYARSTIDIRLQWHLRGAYLLWNHRWLPMWRTNVVLQILHFACGSAQDDRRQLRSG